jgi:thiosulfate/3-mercaptopyruvate sulfurtransferase
MFSRILGSFLAIALSVAAGPALRSDMLVSTDWLAKHSGDSKLVVLQVSGNRTAYDNGHIPGARFVALSDLAITRDGIPNELPAVSDLRKVLEAVGVSDDSRVILYGDASILPATRAYFTLDYLGHGDHAALLDGGLEKWRSEGRALTKDVASVVPGHLTPRAKPELVVQIDEVKQMTAQTAPDSPILLDVRGAADYRGEKGSHIPTALNAYWMEDQVSKENQALRPEAELRKRYEGAGVTTNRPVVTYCNSGMQASESYFTLKYLGYSVRMYDGSMTEWTIKGAPVEK